MELSPLHIKDKPVFDGFFNLNPHELSLYAFENVYIWKELFDIRWGIIEESLCVFFKDKLGCFLYIPPVQKGLPPAKAINAVFKIMDKYNNNRKASRIENIEEKEIDFYRSLGYECREKFPEYICKRSDMVDLKGDKFKSKRSSVNFFLKKYRFKYSCFTASDKHECIGLYDLWASQREEKYKDSLYQGMVDDSRRCLRALMDGFDGLSLKSGLVRLDNAIKAFTFGFALNRDYFCVLYEISDLGVKGLSQYIFRRFCLEQKGCRFINIMDDSGLVNLKNVKLSYRPFRIAPNFIARRK